MGRDRAAAFFQNYRNFVIKQKNLFSKKISIFDKSSQNFGFSQKNYFRHIFSTKSSNLDKKNIFDINFDFYQNKIDF